MYGSGLGDNMKTVVFSDSHGNVAGMCDILRLERPDRVLHLGDCVRDIQEVERQLPGLTINYVRGNCDCGAPAPDVMEPVLEDRRVFMTHGHLYHVKSAYDGAIFAAREKGAHILLFGHTHREFAQRLEDGLWVMNPGSCRGWGPATYGVIVVERGQIFCSIATI